MASAQTCLGGRELSATDFATCPSLCSLPRFHSSLLPTAHTPPLILKRVHLCPPLPYLPEPYWLELKVSQLEFAESSWWLDNGATLYYPARRNRIKLIEFIFAFSLVMIFGSCQGHVASQVHPVDTILPRHFPTTFNLRLESRKYFPAIHFLHPETLQIPLRHFLARASTR